MLFYGGWTAARWIWTVRGPVVALQEPGQRSFVLNGVEFDLGGGLLRNASGEDIPLRPQSLAVLRHLVINANRVVTKDELLDVVWQGIAVTENSLSQCISEIRKALGDDGQTILKTVARRGYRLVLDVEALKGAAQPDSIGFTVPPAAAPRMRRLGVAAIIAIALAAIAAGVAFWWRPPPNPEVPDTLSIAVLPFQNLSDAEEQAYLANGFTDDLTTELARVPDLFVVSRNAARAYGGSDLPPAAIASALGVRYLLQASVQRSGDDIRVNAQLVDALTAAQIWADRFHGQFADVFALQDQVVAEIVGTLELKLVPGKANLAVSGDTDVPQAYQAFRRAVEARALNTPEGTVEALSLLRQALALDPDFGAAATEMAWLYWDTDDARRQALGITWQENDDRLYRSLALAAGNPSPGYYQLTAELLIRERRAVEAFNLAQKALPLDPSDLWTYEELAQALIFAGRPTEARTFLATAVRVDPRPSEWRFYQMGLTAFGEGKFRDAVSELEQLDLGSPNPWPKFYGLHLLVAAHAHLGQTAEAAAALEKLRALLIERREGVPNLMTAQQFLVYAAPADALRLLEGLRKAGVPDHPPDLAIGAAERLDGSAITNLIIGRRLLGRQLQPETLPLDATVATDGTMTKTVGGTTEVGQVWVQDDFICFAFPRHLTNCGSLLRNPSGTAAARNEYTIAFRFGRYEFSVSP